MARWREGERIGTAAGDRDAGRRDRIAVPAPCPVRASRRGTRIRRAR
ncbi:hypothetical protein GBP346_B0992 [Burkholderia pseudomallei MSHR346]|nr:hypothetical protein BUC_5900 [Burkholderia pseudomallei 576]EEP51656.1 hypothetical protein GBP346_B0992 [Burkholderia pseudomallei MSHR346]